MCVCVCERHTEERDTHRERGEREGGGGRRRRNETLVFHDSLHQCSWGQTESRCLRIA